MCLNHDENFGGKVTVKTQTLDGLHTESKIMKPKQKEWFSVRSHEGRHRAHSAKELGIKEMPVFMGYAGNWQT